MELVRQITESRHPLNRVSAGTTGDIAGISAPHALPMVNRPDFASVFDCGQSHMTAGGEGAYPEPLDAVVISDIHLGSDNCQAKLVTGFLENILAGRTPARRLIINGDVFDSIDFRRLKKTHWKVLSMIRHLSDKMEVIWTCGNHDGPAEIVSHLLGVQVLNEFIFTSGGRRMLVLHGHIFDDFIDEHPVLTWFGDLIYNTLQRIDRRHYIARLAKARSKVFLHCLEKVQRKSIAHARRRGCDVVMCGHTHHSAAAREQGIDYFNSGCWTELPPTWLAVYAGRVAICPYTQESVADDLSAEVPVSARA